MASQTNLENGNVNLKIISFNVRGLRNPKKRRTLFHLFKKNKYDIICLQETYLLKSEKNIIKKEWGHLFHIAEGSKNSKGLLTLFSNKFKDIDISIIKENERCLISCLSIDDIFFSIVNVYAPCINTEKTQFLGNISTYLDELQQNHISNLIILGDFNIVLDNKLDIISGERHLDNIVNSFKNFVNKLLIIDIWRYLHGKKREFTWNKDKPFVARRLDYIFTSENLLPFCKDSNIIKFGFSDHKAVFLNIDFSTFKRGPSFFKFNVSSLNDISLVNAISEEITRIKNLDLDPHLKWEYIKASIKDIGKHYGRAKAFEKRQDQKLIQSRLKSLETEISIQNANEETIKQYNELKKKLEIININEAEGARIRAGQKWAQEGEKCTKYFLNLEKHRSNSNIIFSLVGETGEVIRDPGDILESVRSHFQKIYKEDQCLFLEETGREFIDDGKGNVLNDFDKNKLNCNISTEEILDALKKSNNSSAPGSDGLPGEVYKVFWNDIKDSLLACYNFSFELGHLCNTQTTGIICLHHKGKGLSRDSLGNWRPISLTNFDYKLLAKVMANRLNSCLTKCINEDQYAFIKGRQVGDLLREIDDILQVGKNRFPDGIILSLDYAKAFDTISLNAVKKALLYFGFEGNFIKWIDILLNGRKSCVQNGGYLSDYFQMERGVRQGCPISPLLFIITLELLARNIRHNELIKGLKFSEKIIKIKLYADDATLFLRDIIDFREILSRIKSFSRFSGLCLNKQKSSAMLIGNNRFKGKVKCGIKFYNRVKILGVIFSNECCASEISENYDSKIEQLERICSLWGKRYLSIIGRITIIKALGVSLFIYLMQSIGMSEENLKKINLIMYRFIWNPSAQKDKKVTEKVKREIMNKEYGQGGLNMIDVFKLQESFILKWADRLFDSSESSWKNISLIFFENVGGLSAFMSDQATKDFKGLNLIDNSFWRKVLITWLNYKNSEYNKPIRAPTPNDPVFNNSNITYKNQVLFNAKCIKLNLVYIKDFFVNGDIIPFVDFNQIFKKTADSLLVYNTIHNGLSKYKDLFKNEVEKSLHNTPFVNYCRGFIAGDINRRKIYEDLRCTEIEPIKTVWLDYFLLDKEDNAFWCVARDCCSETKIIELQWKILHNIYATGVLLQKMKIKTNDLCEFCGEKDTINHFFVTCQIAKEVWGVAEKIISTKCGRRITLSNRNKVIGILNSDGFKGKELVKCINRLILVCKRTISKFKYEKVGNIKLFLENQLSFRNLLYL